MVDSGMRVWEKQINYNCPAWIPGIIYACSGIIPTSSQVTVTLNALEILFLIFRPTTVLIKNTHFQAFW